jgi:hypothetical protein
MEFTVFCHQITSGSDESLHFSATLEQAEAEAVEYREELREIDPDREPQGSLAIYVRRSSVSEIQNHAELRHARPRSSDRLRLSAMNCYERVARNRPKKVVGSSC